MSRFENRFGDLGDSSADRLVRFVLTLIVATVIVGADAYVLSAALLGPGGNHRAAIASLHAHS
jgi:hypothetical protein